MDLPNSFLPLLQVFAVTMTQPTFQTLQTLIAGWVFAPRRTIAGMQRAAGSERHPSAFPRLFSDARWSVDRAGLAVFDLVTRHVAGTIFLVGDDTLLGRFGLKIFGAGMHRDPVLSSRSHVVTRWGHCWVVLCVVYQSRRTPGRCFALPVLARLYLNKAAAAKWRRVYRSKTDLMREMLEIIQAHACGKSLHFLGDSTYTAPAVLARMPAEIAVTGRVGANVRLCEPPPPRRAGQPGRPRTRGAALPNPGQMLDAQPLPRLTLQLYASGRPYRVRVATQVGRFYKAPARDVKVVATEHLRGGRGREIFYSTQTAAEASVILAWFSQRWPVEVMNQDTQGHLGIEQPQNRTPRAVERTVPTGLLLYRLVVWWHEEVRVEAAPPLRQWRGKRHASFADMLAALRTESLEKAKQTHFSTPDLPPGVQKILQHLEYLFALAA